MNKSRLRDGRKIWWPSARTFRPGRDLNSSGADNPALKGWAIVDGKMRRARSDAPGRSFKMAMGQPAGKDRSGQGRVVEIRWPKTTDNPVTAAAFAETAQPETGSQKCDGQKLKCKTHSKSGNWMGHVARRLLFIRWLVL